MNNPDKEVPTAPAGTDTETDDANIAFTKKQIQNLILTDENKIVEQLYNNYRLFEDKESAEIFFQELNTTAQTLSEKDRSIIQSWILRGEQIVTNYSTENLLFYPVILSRNCTLTEKITSGTTRAVITVTASTQSCQNEKIYHPLIYKIAKTIRQIEIKVFDKKSTVIENISE
jgi:hypothetical protein